MTLITGLIALWVYRRQEHKKVQEAAIILLQEIRFAEESMLTINLMGGITQANCDISILPNNHWSALNHFIINKLTRDEYNAMHRFFSFTAGLERTMRQIERSFCELSMEAKAIKIQDVIIDLLVKHFGEKNESKDTQRLEEEKNESKEYEQIRDRLITEFNKETCQFMPSLHMARLQKNLALVSEISNTSAFQKLRIASEKLPWF